MFAFLESNSIEFADIISPFVIILFSASIFTEPVADDTVSVILIVPLSILSWILVVILMLPLAEILPVVVSASTLVKSIVEPAVAVKMSPLENLMALSVAPIFPAAVSVKSEDASIAFVSVFCVIFSTELIFTSTPLTSPFIFTDPSVVVFKNTFPETVSLFALIPRMLKSLPVLSR